MLTLYDYFRSSASFRVRIALNLKKLSHNVIPIHLVNNGGEQHSSDYKVINPHSLVPSLTEGSRIMTQSLAIIEYLEETHPKPTLLPNSAYDKCLARAFALSIAADIHPLNNLRVLKYLQSELNATDEQKSEWYQHWVAIGFQALEKQLLSYDKHGDFCFGNQPTIADICLVPQVFNAKRFNCDLSSYPTLMRIYTNCEKLDAVTNAWPTEAVN